MNMDRHFQEQVHDVVERMRGALGLDRWEIRPEVGRMEDARAACTADPEYRQATIVFDPEKLQTGDDLEEVVAHELTHALQWQLHAVAEKQAKALAELIPDDLREPFAKLFDENVRLAAETTTTDIGHAFLRLFRRLWKAEAEVKRLREKLAASTVRKSPGSRARVTGFHAASPSQDDSMAQ